MRRKKRVVVLSCAVLTILLLLVCFAGCSASAETAAEKTDVVDASDVKGCWLSLRDLSEEEMALIDLVSSEEDVCHAIFDYHFDESYQGMNIRMNVYQKGELQNPGLLICRIPFDSFSRDGAVSLTQEESRFRVHYQDKDGGGGFGVRNAEDYLKIPGNGGGHFSSRQGEKDSENRMILYTAGVFEGTAARRLSGDTDIDQAIYEDSQTFDTYTVVYAEGY